jgi:HlyD family secretion protein
MKAPFIAAAAIIAAGASWLAYQRISAEIPANHVFGNVEIRQVDLAFNSEGTVLKLEKREGDKVRAGEEIATLDDATYRSSADLAHAKWQAAQAQLNKLLNGSRREDIEQARAAVASAQAMKTNAQITLKRMSGLARTSAVSRQQLDDAQRAMDSAVAQLALNLAALDESLNGPRAEDIDIARAQLRQAQASDQLAQTELARTILHAPSNGIVMTRVIEPGTVVMPNSIVYSVAITDEVWVRAFVPEPLLGQVVPGSKMAVYTDSKPDHPYHGVIGYVAPQAEFTPKTVETPELRSQLVYRIRVRITDADNHIRQGQPVTLVIDDHAKP